MRRPESEEGRCVLDEHLAAAHPVIARIIADGEPIVREYGYSAIAVSNFAEGLGVPLPGQATLIAGALLANRGDFQIAWIVTVALAATVAGNCAGYWLGRLGGRRLLAYLPVREERLARVDFFFERRALLLVFAARFLDGFRQTVPLLAGTMNMPWWRFFAANLTGSIAWVGLWGGGIYLLGRDFHGVLARIHSVGEHGAWLAGALLVALAAWLYLRKPGNAVRLD